MNTTSRTITGGAGSVLGIFLIVLAIKDELWILMYGIPILIISIYIFFNKKEDKIEEIKQKNE